jgi:hypothetical protein
VTLDLEHSTVVVASPPPPPQPTHPTLPVQPNLAVASRLQVPLVAPPVFGPPPKPVLTNRDLKRKQRQKLYWGQLHSRSRVAAVDATEAPAQPQKQSQQDQLPGEWGSQQRRAARQHRIEEFLRKFGRSETGCRIDYDIVLDDDGDHFSASVRQPPVTYVPPTSLLVPAPSTTLPSKQVVVRPVIAQAPKGKKALRNIPYSDYTATPRKPGMPIPRNGDTSDEVGRKLLTSPAAVARRDAKLAASESAARRARVAKMHRDSFPVVAATATTTDPSVSTPRHFFADCAVAGFSQPVRMTLDNGSDLSTCDNDALPPSMEALIVPLPESAQAYAFDGTRADMSNFLGTLLLRVTLGSFSSLITFYVLKRGMSPFVLSKFVQADMEAEVCYKTWRFRPGARYRPLSREQFSITLAHDVVVLGEVMVKAQVSPPESLFRQPDGSLDSSLRVYLSGCEVNGVCSTSQTQSTTEVNCRPVLAADVISLAQIIPDAPVTFRNAGSGRTTRMRTCLTSIRLLSNTEPISLTAGLVIAHGYEYREQTTPTKLAHPALGALSSLGSPAPLLSPTIFASPVALHDESDVFYDDDPVPEDVAHARVESKIAETMADDKTGCPNRHEFTDAIRTCLSQMHLGPDEDGRIGGAALGVEHVIVGPEGHRPQQRRNYQYSHEEIVFIDETIKKLLAQGVIEHAATGWVSPIVVATHPRTGKLRFCVDYRGVNSLTTPDAYSLPRIKQVFEAVAGMDVLSIVDVAQAFPHVPIAKESKKFTGFRGPRGDLYQHCGSPFGLTSLPATWQRYMETMFAGMLWTSVCVYVDDILVFSKDIPSHILLLDQIFALLRQHNLALRVDKCHFFKFEVEYLGFLLSGKGVRAVPASVAKILESPAPVDKAEIRRFMGMAEQYRPFIPNFAKIAKPLTRQQGKAKKGAKPVPFQWLAEEQSAFDALKLALADTPVLALPDLSRPFRIYIDASEFAMGAILCQLDEEAREHVIGYYSKMMNPAQINYMVSEKECLAVHHFITTLRHFFAGGGPHELLTDHAALTALTKGELHNRRMIRWATELASFNFVIKHIPGSTMPADALTKGPIVRASPEVMEAASRVSPLGAKWAVQTGVISAVSWKKSAPGDMHLVQRLDLGGQTVAQLQQDDARVRSWFDFVSQGRPQVNRKANSAARKLRKQLELATRGMLIEGNQLRRYANRSIGGLTQLVVPASLTAALLLGAHEGTAVGYHAGLGGEAMFRALSPSFYWPELHLQCVRYLPNGNCATCTAANRPAGRPAGLLHHVTTGRPFEHMAMDCVQCQQILKATTTCASSCAAQPSTPLSSRSK